MYPSYPQLMEWMQDAGMRTWLDDIGNVHGRIDSKHPNAPATLFGVCLWDGWVGVLCSTIIRRTTCV